VVNSTAFTQLSRIKDILIKRKEKAKELTLFAEFITEHPGLLHRGGVNAGGTFVVVYQGTTKKVVADFSLPYRIEEEVEDKDTEPLKPSIRPKWTNLNDLVLHLDKEQYFEDKISALNLNVKTTLEGFQFTIDKKTLDLQQKISDQTTSVSKAYSDGMGVLINSVDTILKAKETAVNLNGVKTGAGFSSPEYTNAAEVIDAANKYRGYYEEKVKAGTATEDDKEMAKAMDEAAGKVISNNVKRMAAKDKDIQVASEDAKFMEYAINEAKNIKDEAARKSVSTEARKAAEANATKEILVNRLKEFG
jgi:hypothetical protein